MRTLLLACLLALVVRWAGGVLWRFWRYGGDELPPDLRKQSY